MYPLIIVKAQCMYMFGHLYIGPVSVPFNQTSHRVVENVNVVQSALVLSDPPSTDITIPVSNTGELATGE